MEDFEMVVIGAGLYGLTAASTYHRLHPESNLLVVEASSSLGGPWAPDRTFPGLKTNNLFGTYQIPDFAMDEAEFGVKKGEHVPAAKMTEYLHAFARENDIEPKIRLNTRVKIVEKVESGWRLHVNNSAQSSDEETTAINTSKLIIAVGLTNQPCIPRFPTSPNFEPTVIHSYQFARHFEEIVKEGTHTLIVGGGKSAWDMAYACATQPNSTATMLIRPSGKGPIWMAPSHVTPFSLWLEKLVFTRFFGFLSPCPWAEMSGLEGWLRSFFHRTWLGRKIVNAFWGILGDDVIQLNKFDEHPETKKLKPWRSAFETGNALSILNYPTNFFDLVKEGKVKVVFDEIGRLGDGKEVHLKNGESFGVDAVVCATGWETGGNMQFKPESLQHELGLATKDKLGVEEEALIKKVEKDIYTGYPFLKTRDTRRIHHPDPALRYEPTSETSQQPYRLYRFMIPPALLQQRSIGFAGTLLCLGTPTCAYLQSLWLTAYLDDTLKLPETSNEQIEYETYRNTQYCVLRNAAGHGTIHPDLVFDSLPYFDELLRDLGFEGKRKGGILGLKNWAAESVRSYGPEDYFGLVEEWKKKMDSSIAVKKTV